MAAKSTPKTVTQKPTNAPTKSSASQTTLVPLSWGKKSPATNGSKGKPKATPNGNIMAFFKKAEEQNNRLFMEDKSSRNMITLDDSEEQGVGWTDRADDVTTSGSDEAIEQRYNENGGSNKRQRVIDHAGALALTPPPMKDGANAELNAGACEAAAPAKPRRGPFVDDSESEAEEGTLPMQRKRTSNLPLPAKEPDADDGNVEKSSMLDPTADSKQGLQTPPSLEREVTSPIGGDDFAEFGDIDDDEFLEGEENDERRWMEEQQRLELAEAGIHEFDDMEVPPMFPDTEPEADGIPVEDTDSTATALCPMCQASLKGLSDEQASVHVNGCLDGNPVSLPTSDATPKETTPMSNNGSKMFKRPARPPRPGQQNPFQIGTSASTPRSAFSKLMAGHAEDAAWASAAAAEHAARGKPSYQRTCPFYKILPGFYICVDAFRYGAVKGQNAYFLSHFHSDHYVGLTSSWRHGPIYCSKVTANLVRQQLQVDPKWVVDLEFEKRTEVPGTEGVYVTMITANHCPGSSLFLFEKGIDKGKTSRLQRVLHCGDFRACQAHIEHPLLRPDVLDAVSGKNRQQKLDVCYLDTTYLNPKYAFPPQHQVIQACADMCVSLNKEQIDDSDGWEQMKRERAGEGMVKFLHKDSETQTGSNGSNNSVEKQDELTLTKSRGRLLVVVGTYSIGKERICVGIAKALGSKIYASKSKQRICHALEDSELNALITSDPREAQVHMTPLFEIRADTLEDYLRDYRDRFSRAVAFRPSGWNYRPPNSRFTESPQVQTVLRSHTWKSQFAMRDLKPQPGSTSRASCFGVPYSEHSSFRELTMFCCALRIDKIIPTVNVGSARSRERMKAWCDKWAADKKKNGLFKLKEDGGGWE
jgi:DNA cross-link repair 1A protein